MSKSFYQYQLSSSDPQAIDSIINQVLYANGYTCSVHPNSFSKGSGWWLVKRCLEYAIIGDTLNICVWKPWAIFVPSLEVANLSADNFFGGVVNSELKNTVQAIAMNISQYCSVTPLVICQTVPDNHIANVAGGLTGYQPAAPVIQNQAPIVPSQAPVQPEAQTIQRFCNKCGCPIVPGAKFCRNCGNPLS